MLSPPATHPVKLKIGAATAEVSFQTAEETLAGIEAFHILRKKPKIEMAFLIYATQTILLLVVRFFWFPDIIKCEIYFSLAAH
jgi:hypothetical protein